MSRTSFHPTLDRLTFAFVALVVLLALPASAEVPGVHPAIDTVVNYTTGNCQWSPPLKESSGIAYECPGGLVMAGMKHSGDENGNTEYQCCAFSPQPVTKYACAWSTSIRESNSQYTCPGLQLMAGREHSGDENGGTKYECCNFDNPSGQMWPNDTTCEWIGPQKQSASNLTCPSNKVMRGRSHQGDENGNTYIYCCGVEGPG